MYTNAYVNVRTLVISIEYKRIPQVSTYLFALAPVGVDKYQVIIYI